MAYCLTNSVLNKTSAAFRIGGPDANTYLQGQFTQDLNVPVPAACYGLFLNQKGKVLADSWVMRLGPSEFMLVSFSSGADALRERLEAYLVADEVTITDETVATARISLWGAGAAEAVAALVGAVPVPGQWCGSQERLAWGGRWSRSENFEILVPVGQLLALQHELQASGVTEVDVMVAERERIAAGIPAVPVDIGLNDLPNEGGLDEVAISYTKGCYLGQEVMARLKNLGQIRRRLQVVRGPGGVPLPGTALYQGETKVGEIRSGAPEEAGFVAFAMMSLVNFQPALPLALIAGGEANLRRVER